MTRALFVVKAGKEGGLEFKSDFHRARFKDFLKENAGVELDIKLHSGELSGEQRRYFEGAIVPAIADFHEMEIDDARELIKREFNGKYVITKKGDFGKVAMSTTKLNKKGFSEFLERIIQWMAENGIPIPDPEDYKRWRDSSPLRGETYQPKWLSKTKKI